MSLNRLFQKFKSKSLLIIVFHFHSFEYRQAVQPLPFDTLFHSFLLKKSTDQYMPSLSSHLAAVAETNEDVRRIRGGGIDQDKSSTISLASLKVNSIDDNDEVFVFGWAKVNENSSHEFFVGLASQERNQDAFNVKALFTYSSGTLKEPKKIMCIKSSVYFVPGVKRSSNLVDVLSVAKATIQKLKKQLLNTPNNIIYESSEPKSLSAADLKTAPPSSIFIYDNEVEDMDSIEEEGDVTDFVKEINYLDSLAESPHESQYGDYEVKRMKSAVLIEEDLGMHACSLLGVLPTGDAVHWFCSDPRCLYLRRQPISSRGILIDVALNISAFNINSNNAGNTGLNGVDAISENSNINPFYFNRAECNQSKNFFHHNFDHIRQKYDSSSRHSCEWIRIDAGKKICDVCVDFTNYLCARCIGLKDFVVEYVQPCVPCERSTVLPWQSIIFDFERLVIFSEDGLPNLTKLEHLKLSAHEKELVTLWIKIACLFRVEYDGSYRLEKSLRPISDIVTVEEDYRLQKNITSTIHDDIFTDQSMNGFEADIFEPVPVPCHGCSGDVANGLNCEVCRCPGDGIVSSEKDIHGVGCCLLSDVCYDYKDDSQRRNILDAMIQSPRTTLDIMKNLILKISANVPFSLYRRTTESGSKISSIWGENLNIWIQTVQNSLTARGLSQALLLLKQSIEISKMPKWWKTTNCGWVSTVAISVCTNASVSLQLFVLDAAIAEYSADANCEIKSRDSSKLAQIILYRKERFALLQKWAVESNINVHKGSSSDECMICDDGGDLLCCEYCPNVAHQICVGLKQDLSEDEVWICDACRDRITEARPDPKGSSFPA